MNARAAYAPAAAALAPAPLGRTPTSDDLRADRRERLPAAGVPRVVVLDDAGIHTRKVVRAARPSRTAAGSSRYDSPPYRPERNRIEPVFKRAERHGIPIRSYTRRPAGRKAVEGGFDADRRRLAAKDDKEPRRRA